MFSEFPPISKQEWLTKIEKDLKGKPLDTLDWKVAEDWTISPFAHSDDLPIKQLALASNNKANNSWEIGEVISVTETKVANKEALAALIGGATALLFELPEKFIVAGFEELLKDIELAWISIHFQASSASFNPFLDYLKMTKFDLAILKGSWRSKDVQLKKQFDLPQFKLLLIDGKMHYKDTAHTIEELTNILLEANTIMKKIEASQADHLQVSIAIGESYFINIAKIRALKILWHNLMTAYQLETPLHLEAHLAAVSLTNDQHQNRIQMSTQALSAVIGGVDRLFLTPTPSTQSAFNQRIARNVQHLLQLESHLDHVVDPAAGSYYIENLTNQITERVWENFVKAA